MLKIFFCASLLAFFVPYAYADQPLRALTSCGNLSSLPTIRDIDNSELQANIVRKQVSAKIQEIAARDQSSKENACRSVEPSVSRYEALAQQIADANPKAAEAAKALGENDCARELLGDAKGVATSATNLRTNFTQAGCPAPQPGGGGVR